MGKIIRETRETRVEVSVDLAGSGPGVLDTGIPFLDHMLSAMSLHGGFALDVSARGDLEVDDHHTAEDVAIAIGSALKDELAGATGFRRFGSRYAPLDESLVRAVVDLSGRPYCYCSLDLNREAVGTLATENVPHFFRSFANAAAITLHVDLIRGENDHHKIEAAFKAVALALKEAFEGTGTSGTPSTKGTLGFDE